MKVLWFAAAVLTVAVLFIGWSGWYMEEVCASMRGFLEQLPEGEERDLKGFGLSYRRLESYWYGRRRWVQMITGKKETQEVSRRLVEMGMRYIGGDTTGYKAEREGLKQYLEELGMAEKVTWEGIL